MKEEIKVISKEKIKAMSYKKLLSVIVSGCKFKYYSYDHKKALVEYRSSDKYIVDRKYYANPDSWDMPLALKEKYKVEKIGKLREITFSPNGKACRFRIGNKYYKSFYIEDFGLEVFPLISN